MRKKMSHKKLFFSASDADSDGVEGKYFVYDYDNVVKNFMDNGYNKIAAEDMCSYLHITPSGNFEGRSIVRLEQERPDEYEKAIKVLRDIRDRREYPFIDKKVITAWNAMLIKSLFIMANYEKKFLLYAEESLSALLQKLYINGRLYHTAMINSDPKVDAFLEDYAYLSTALIQAYQVTLNKEHLLLAQVLCNKALELFFEGGKWYFSKGEFITEADIGDSSYPGSIGVMIDALLSLGTLVDEKYRRFAFMSLEYYSAQLVKRPVHYPYLFNQAMRYLKEDRVIKGNKKALLEYNDAILKTNYPYLLRSLEDIQEILLCGVQSCYASLKPDADLQVEIDKTL